MSDEGDRSCPLCAEEMDLTDQQLKPCKCGYEICVWCWHHIMAMAEKDQKQGRCPACRNPYNKEIIVGTTANCERLVAEMNMEKKKKSQKTKNRLDGRKQLGNVRVIQKTLVYIVGLPLTLADENLLHHRDYFGRYGKVLKVSISRTAAGSIQQFANNTCSVYITYSKEEEAARCIQSVHGFVLNDKTLRACFGTTKYCHSWLRNVPCSNPDCLYLHEFGTQEDSFIKDETVSPFSRSRVQPITGATSNVQRRAGNVLPSPADECHLSSFTLTEKPIRKSASNNTTTTADGSQPNNSSVRSAALPPAASWGARASNGNPPSGNIACSNGSSKQKPETSGSADLSTAIAATVQVPRLHAETRKKVNVNEGTQNKPHKGGQVPPKSSSNSAQEAVVRVHSPPLPKEKERCTTNRAPIETISVELAGLSCGSGTENNLNISVVGSNNNLCSGTESMNISSFIGENHSGTNRSNSLLSSVVANSSVNQGPQQFNAEDFREPSLSISPGKTIAMTDNSQVPIEQSGLTQELTMRQSEMESNLQIVRAKSDSQVASPRPRQNFQSLEVNELNDSEYVTSSSYYSASSPSLHHSNISNVHSPIQPKTYGSSTLIRDPPLLNSNVENSSLRHHSDISAVTNDYSVDMVNSYVNSDRNFGHACLENKLVGRSDFEAANCKQNIGPDMGESSIISNILSLDFDPWEESLTSPQSLVKILGEGDKQQGPIAPSSSRKAQNSNKSRFSFARTDEYGDLPSNVEPSSGPMQQVFGGSPLSHDFALNRDMAFDKFGDWNGFSTLNTKESENLSGSISYQSSNNFSGSRSQVSAPPGFSTLNKAPPPGFAFHDRMGSNFDGISGHRFLDASSLLSNLCQSPGTENIGSSTDIEFMDPAILAVGKERLPIGLNNGVGLDMMSNFPHQLNALENNARFQSLMQRSSPPVQNLKFSGIMDNGFRANSDTRNYLPSRIIEQTPVSNQSPISLLLQQPRNSMMPNGQRNGWSEGKSANDMGMAELLRAESLSFNKFYGSYEDSKFRIPSSGELYNRTYGI